MTALAQGKGRVGFMLAAWAILVAISAVILYSAQQKSRSEIEDRFGLRAELTADFITTYASDFLRQERLVAERSLSGETPSNRTFDLVVTSLESGAAVLLDSDGKVLQVAPKDPSVVGSDVADEYVHLETAVEGTPAVSNVVPSAADGVGIVAFATPFKSKDGLRVFSAGFDIRSTPLARYLAKAAAVKPNGAYLVDASGVVLATNDADARQSAELPATIAPFANRDTMGSYAESDDFVISQPIDGTPWQLLMTTPESFLFATVSGSSRVIPWLVWLGFAALGLLSIWLFSRLTQRRKALLELNERLERQANIDSLTGVANRHRMEREIQREIKRAERDGTSLSMLAVDIDSFKGINDSSGHAVGDEVLRSVADGLGATLRDTDVLGRWGGDEFLIALPGIDAAGSAAVAQRLLERVRATPFMHDDGVVSVTISIGCAEWTGESPESLVHTADQALYVAKDGGRDRFEVADAAELHAQA